MENSSTIDNILDKSSDEKIIEIINSIHDDFIDVLRIKPKTCTYDISNAEDTDKNNLLKNTNNDSLGESDQRSSDADRKSSEEFSEIALNINNQKIYDYYKNNPIELQDLKNSKFIQTAVAFNMLNIMQCMADPNTKRLSF